MEFSVVCVKLKIGALTSRGSSNRGVGTFTLLSDHKCNYQIQGPNKHLTETNITVSVDFMDRAL